MQTILSGQYVSALHGYPEIVTLLKTHGVAFTGLDHDEEYFPIIAGTGWQYMLREEKGSILPP